MSTPRRKFKRPSGKNRDASLFIIASEGKETEKIYIEALEELIASPRLHIVFHKKKDSSKSSPRQTLQTIKEVSKEFQLNSNDQLWILIDTDRWEVKELSTVASESRKSNIHLAISNPCFELWCILHLKKISEYSPEEIEKIKTNPRVDSKKYLEKELSNLLKGAKKTSAKIGDLVIHYLTAIDNAIEIDIQPDSRFPISPGTRVYKLLIEIQKKLGS